MVKAHSYLALPFPTMHQCLLPAFGRHISILIIAFMAAWGEGAIGTTMIHSILETIHLGRADVRTDAATTMYHVS